MNTYRLNNNFLKNLPHLEMAGIDKRLADWGLGTEKFEGVLDRWFNNFENEADRRLALKLFFHLDYFNVDRFNDLISNARIPIERRLIENGLEGVRNSRGVERDF